MSPCGGTTLLSDSVLIKKCIFCLCFHFITAGLYPLCGRVIARRASKDKQLLQRLLQRVLLCDRASAPAVPVFPHFWWKSVSTDVKVNSPLSLFLPLPPTSLLQVCLRVISSKYTTCKILIHSRLSCQV